MPRGRRVQVVLSEYEYNLLKEYAAETKQSISAIIRQALRKTVLADMEMRRKAQALARLAAGDTPVLGWPEMEKAIVGGPTKP